MNRRELLAILPSLSALPFLSSKIEKDEKKGQIIMHEVQPIEVVKEIPKDLGVYLQPHRIKVALLLDNQIVAYATEHGVESDHEVYDMRLEMLDSVMVRRPRLQVRASFDDEKVMEVMRAFVQSKYGRGR
jgi:hypothetical protein